MNSKKLKMLRDHFPEGSFTTKDAKSYGVSPRMLTFYVNKEELKRIGRGLYIFPDFDVDEDFKFSDLALRARSIKGSVICLISALSYWDIPDEIPRDFWLALPNNYPLPKNKNNIHFIRPRDIKTGVIKKTMALQEVLITNPERSICDAFKYLDEESYIGSLRHYLSQESEKIKMKELLDTAIKIKSSKLIKMLKDIAISQAQKYPSLKSSEFRDTVKWLSRKRAVNE